MNRRKGNEIKKQGILVESLDWLRLIIISLFIVYFVPAFVIRPLRVSGDSMVPTFIDQDFAFTNVFTNLVFGVERFDVVIVKDTTSGDNWVKRIIGLPNEKVEVRSGKLYIDGVYYEEPFLDPTYMISKSGNVDNFTKDFSSERLGEDEYFVMGDNRNESTDSRARGPFKRSEIIGKHMYVVYPFDRMKVVDDGK